MGRRNAKQKASSSDVPENRNEPKKIVRKRNDKMTTGGNDNQSLPEKNQEPIVEVKEPMPWKSFDSSLICYLNRKWSSAEQLNLRFVKKAELEVANKWHYLADMKRPNEVTKEKQIKLMSLNYKKTREAIKLNEFPEKLATILWNLVLSYTADNHQLFKKDMDEMGSEVKMIKMALIEAIIKNCKTISTCSAEKEWKIRKVGRKKTFEYRFVEIDEDVDFNEEPFIVEKCSKNHTKCRWLKLFMSILLPSQRFSLYGIFENEKESGPFRDEVFLHCMKYGAHCQKSQFLFYGVPFGNLEDTINDFTIDHTHIVAVREKSLEKILFFIENGFDVNSFAKRTKNDEILILSDYIEEWSRKLKIKKESQRKQLDLTHYQNLSDFLRKIGCLMNTLLYNEIRQHILLPAQEKFRVAETLTLPHILHCTPVVNKANFGTGENQVLSCIYYPQGCRVKNGIEKDKNNDVEYWKKFEKVQNLIKKNQARICLVVYRIEIKPIRVFSFEQTRILPIPKIVFISSDEGFEIEKMTILRQGENLKSTEADLPMKEIKKMSTPGQKIFGFELKEIETDLLVPGMAHIELTGKVSEAMNFMVQLIVLEHSFDG